MDNSRAASSEAVFHTGIAGLLLHPPGVRRIGVHGSEGVRDWQKLYLRPFLHRSSDFDQIPVRVIKAHDLLSPAVRHQSVHIPNFRVIRFQPRNEAINIGFLEIQFTGIALGDDIFAEGQKRMEDLQDSQNRLSAELEAKQQLLRARLDELARYWDRFM